MLVFISFSGSSALWRIPWTGISAHQLMRIFFLLSHGFFSEIVFQPNLPTFPGLLWVLPLGWLFPLKKSSSPSSELHLCFLFLHDFFFKECFIPFLPSKKLPDPLFPSPDIVGEKPFSQLISQNPGIRMSELSIVIILEYVTDLKK